MAKETGTPEKALSAEEVDSRLRFFENLEGVRRVRGTVLDQAIEVENALNDVLSAYFIDREEKRAEFRATVLEEEFFSFQKKIQILDKIGVHRDKKYAGLFQNLVGDLMYIVAVRNSLAHRPQETIRPYVVLKLPKGPKPERIDNKFLSTYLLSSSRTIKKLTTLQMYLEFRI